MAEVFYLHWNQQEAEKTVRSLEAAGHTVRYHWNTETVAKFEGWLPQIAIISLERLPSHGRSYAEWLWEAKYRRNIPILFLGSKPDKIEPTRAKFPDATFCARDDLIPALAHLVHSLMPEEPGS